MLVLARKKDESIVIGDQVKLTVVEIRGGAVRLGVEAPLEVSVHRGEVHEAIRQEAERQGVPLNVALAERLKDRGDCADGDGTEPSPPSFASAAEARGAEAVTSIDQESWVRS